MAAPEGNRYWELRKKHGRDKKYDPETLWESACEYFQWSDENPWIKTDFVRGGEFAGSKVELPTSRPYTLMQLCVHLGINTKTFEEYAKLDDFSQITTHIREIVFSQKFEGAAVGAFNANLIARELGLADKKETKWSGDLNTTITGMEIK